MPPRRGRGRRGAAEPEDRVDRIERILEGLVQVVHDVHNNNNHDDAPATTGNANARSRSDATIVKWEFISPAKKVVSQGSSGSNELPTCPICQKKHRGECRMGTRACYGCGQEGHQIRDCPMRNRIQGAGTSASASVQQPPTERGNNQPRQGRAFALVPGNTPATTSVVSGILPICGSTCTRTYGFRLHAFICIKFF
ncbi:hypothetical protein Acr_01g0008900 [Actinidia rufa]|uniref:CCHC-type domain-containing protein n=1 Tax=Actinidia rufa TaxID=165716 RepID=A0A7J0E3J0_9ERIC|nr:hypothetical protein Acr_01g0008900 [Actinidia rufa]